MPITDKLDNVIGKVAGIAGTTADYAASGHTIEEKVDYISELLDGIASGGGNTSVVYVSAEAVAGETNTFALDKTFSQIENYMKTGYIVYIINEDKSELELIVGLGGNDLNGYFVKTHSTSYIANEVDDYPKSGSK